MVFLLTLDIANHLSHVRLAYRKSTVAVLPVIEA